MKEPDYTSTECQFDPTRTYRYSLTRRWGSNPAVLWILLNPSTADEVKLDPTLRRCLGFTRSFRAPGEGEFKCLRGPGRSDFECFHVCNLYGYRSKKPSPLWKLDDPVGLGNDMFIRQRVMESALVVVGWGAEAKPDRERKVAQMLYDMGVQPMALHVTSRGSPGHPLYLPSSSTLSPWLCKGLR